MARGARGKLVATRLDEAGAQVLRALLERQPKVKDSMIEDVGVGNVAGGRSEFAYLGNIQRLAGLPLEVCSFHANRQCGSSMETLHRVAMAIALGTIECGVAMGVERMGRGLGGGDGKATRVNRMTDRIGELNAAQLAPAPDHATAASDATQGRAPSRRASRQAPTRPRATCRSAWSDNE